MSTSPTPRRRRRGPLARLGERTGQFAYIGVWASLFLVAGFISAGATWVPLFDRGRPPAPAVEAGPGPAPRGITEGGLRLAAKVIGTQVRPAIAGRFQPRFWAGVNLGASVPGQSPGAVAATRADYDRWLREMGSLGVSVVRVYTILSPSFYDAVRDYDLRHADRPIHVLQGIWIPEERFTRVGDIWDPGVVARQRREIEDAVGAVSGDASIRKVPGHAGGSYRSDITPWLMGWSFGVEWDPAASAASDATNAGRAPYRGRFFGAKAGATPMESWIASNLDHIAALQARRGWSVPITFTNWDTTDPLTHTEEPLPIEDAVSIDATHVYATARWPAGYFASFHAYPYYPDFQRWQPEYQRYRRALDGAPDPYAGYLDDLRRHHPRMPVMITEFGQPTSLGCAHLAKLGRDQGCHSEAEAARNIAEMLRVQRAEGMAGGIVFEWLDEWFKFTWNTIDYELPGDRRGLWRSVLTNEEHFGLIAAEPGARSTVDLDGRDLEWTADDPVIARGSGSVTRAATRYDAENVYLRLDVAPQLWRRRRIVIGLDARPGGNRGLPGLPGVDAEAEMAVVIDPGPRPTARMYHAGWIEALGIRFGGFASPERSSIPTKLEDIQPGSGAWVRLRQILNYPYDVHSGRVDAHQDVEVRDASLLPWGTAVPGAPGFDDRNLIMGRGGVLEIALPWSMMSFADPSSHRLYVVSPNRDDRKTVTTRRADRVGIAVQVEGEPLLRTRGFTWKGWDTVEWHERRKAGWPIIRRAFEEFRGGTAPVTR